MRATWLNAWLMVVLYLHICRHAMYFTTLQASNQGPSCKSEDYGRSCVEKLPPKQPTFQIHVDEPDGACSKKQVQPSKSSTMDASPLTLNPTVTRLRQPLATIDLPMDVSFGMFFQN